MEKSNWRKNRGYCIFKCKIIAIYITNGKIRDIVKLSKKPSRHKTCSRHLGIVLELSCLDKTFSRYLNFILESSYLVDLFIYTYTHTNTRTHTDIHIYIYIYIYICNHENNDPSRLSPHHHNGFVDNHALGHMMHGCKEHNISGLSDPRHTECSNLAKAR